MITAAQLLAHLWGDYILQSDWMANNKTKSSFAASVHANVYSLPFLLFAPSWKAMLVISMSHFLIDRYRLARYVVWAKNFLAPKRHFICNMTVDGGNEPPYPKTDPRHWYNKPHRYWRFRHVHTTGYPLDAPIWLSTWLLIIADNILHITINGLALRYL